MNNTDKTEFELINAIINSDKKSHNVITILYFILKINMYLSLFTIITSLLFMKQIIYSDNITGDLKFKGIFLIVLVLFFFSYLISDFIQTLVSKYISKNIKIILEDIVEEYYTEISLDDFKNLELTTNQNQDNFLEMGYLYGKKTRYDFYNASNYFTIKNDKKSTTFSNVKALALGDMKKYTNDVNESMSFDGIFFCNSFTDKNSNNFKITAFIFNVSNFFSYILLSIFISIPFILELMVESLNSLVLIISIIIMSSIFFYFYLFKSKLYEKDDSGNIDLNVTINDKVENSKEISKEIVDFVNKNKVRIYAYGAKNKNNLLIYRSNNFFRVISGLSKRNNLSYLQNEIILIRDAFKLNFHIRENLSYKEE